MEVLIEVAVLSGCVFIILCVLHKIRKHDEFCREYAEIVAKYGPNNERAKHYRKLRANNASFLKFADKYDEIKKAVGGSGIDYPPED